VAGSGWARDSTPRVLCVAAAVVVVGWVLAFIFFVYDWTARVDGLIWAREIDEVRAQLVRCVAGSVVVAGSGWARDSTPRVLCIVVAAVVVGSLFSLFMI
jgi:hypothetical protein